MNKPKQKDKKHACPACPKHHPLRTRAVRRRAGGGAALVKHAQINKKTLDRYVRQTFPCRCRVNESRSTACDASATKRWTRLDAKHQRVTAEGTPQRYLAEQLADDRSHPGASYRRI